MESKDFSNGIAGPMPVSHFFIDMGDYRLYLLTGVQLSPKFPDASTFAHVLGQSGGKYRRTCVTDTTQNGIYLGCISPWQDSSLVPTCAEMVAMKWDCFVHWNQTTLNHTVLAYKPIGQTEEANRFAEAAQYLNNEADLMILEIIYHSDIKHKEEVAFKLGELTLVQQTAWGMLILLPLKIIYLITDYILVYRKKFFAPNRGTIQG